MKLKDATIVLTGKFSTYSRADAKKALAAKGATVSSSISGKTTLLIAGPGAGSKIQAAFDKKVPIAGEGHLELLLGGMPLEDVIELANTFYTFDRVAPDDAPEGSYSRVGGEGPLEHVGGGHMFTLDCATMPALQAFLSGVRLVSVYRSSMSVDMYNADAHNVTVSKITQQQLDANGREPGEMGGQALIPRANPRDEIDEYFGATRALGGVPLWCQYDASPRNGLFLFQCGEGWGLSGDGLVYVFDTAVVTQFT